MNTSPTPPSSPSSFQLKVQASGSGTGMVSSTPSGISCGSTCAATYQSGTKVTLTANPSANSTFVGWGGACSGTSTCTVMLTANVSVTATFAPKSTPEKSLIVSLAGSGTGTVTSSPSGINCGTVCSANFASGTKVTLTATPGTNSTFAGWSGACSGTGTCQVTLTGNTAVTATFNTSAPPPVTLSVTLSGPANSGSVTSQPAGINCGTICNATFQSGTPVTLTASPATGYNFAGWSGACSGSNPICNLTLTANTSVTATFQAVQGLNSINHIIFMAQENRSFDSYFGAMRAYWAATGVPDQSFNGLPQFNPQPGNGAQGPFYALLLRATRAAIPIILRPTTASTTPVIR